MYEWARTGEKIYQNKHERISTDLILKEITSSRPHGPRENKSGYYTKSSASMGHTCWKYLSLSCPIYWRNVLILINFIDKPYYTVKTYQQDFYISTTSAMQRVNMIMNKARAQQNSQNDKSVQQRWTSACTSAQSDRSHCCPYKEALCPWISIERPAKTLIGLRGCSGWSESSLDTYHCEDFIVLLIISLMLNFNIPFLFWFYSNTIIAV